MDKRVLTIAGAVVAGAFLVGRYTGPERVKIETKTEIREVRVTDESRKLETTQRIIETTKPDGSKVKDTRIKTKRESEKSTAAETKAASHQVKEIESRRGVLVSPLIGVRLDDLSGGAIFGAHISKQFIGPLHLGAWGLSDFTVGVSLGLEF